MSQLLPLAIAALVGTATLAQAASNSFYLPRVQDSDGVINLPLVSAEADGLIEVYAANDSQRGVLLGTQAVTAGANTDVRVALTIQPLGDAVAVLNVGGEAVAEQAIELYRGGAR